MGLSTPVSQSALPLFADCSLELAFFLDTGFLVMLSFLELRDDPGFLTLLPEAPKRFVEGLVLLNAYFSHAFPLLSQMKAKEEEDSSGHPAVMFRQFIIYLVSCQVISQKMLPSNTIQ
jgi:hypothetical protein